MTGTGRPLVTALALMLSASVCFSQTSGTWDPKLGGGATGLLYGAIKFMEKDGKPDACLSGMKALVNIYTPADPHDPRTRAGAISKFHFYFWSPTKPPKTALSINLPIAGGPEPQQTRYNEYDPYYTPPGSIFDVRPTCISELRVDTDKALEVAAKNGLPLGTMSAYELKLIHAASPDEADWKDRALRKRVFWVVSLPVAKAATERQYLVDALTGKFIKARMEKISR